MRNKTAHFPSVSVVNMKSDYFLFLPLFAVFTGDKLVIYPVTVSVPNEEEKVKITTQNVGRFCLSLINFI